MALRLNSDGELETLKPDDWLALSAAWIWTAGVEAWLALTLAGAQRRHPT